MASAASAAEKGRHGQAAHTAPAVATPPFLTQQNAPAAFELASGELRLFHAAGISAADAPLPASSLLLLSARELTLTQLPPAQLRQAAAAATAATARAGLPTSSSSSSSGGGDGVCKAYCSGAAPAAAADAAAAREVPLHAAPGPPSPPQNTHSAPGPGSAYLAARKATAHAQAPPMAHASCSSSGSTGAALPSPGQGRPAHPTPAQPAPQPQPCPAPCSPRGGTWMAPWLTPFEGPVCLLHCPARCEQVCDLKKAGSPMCLSVAAVVWPICCLLVGRFWLAGVWFGLVGPANTRLTSCQRARRPFV